MSDSLPSGKTLYLFSTEGCHLCEQALELIEFLHVQPTEVDIADDDALYARYGVTIPVLKSDSQELQWPFNLEELQLWLDENGITYHT